MWVLVGSSFVVAVGYGIVAPALPSFARSFDVGVTAASAVISVFAVLRVAFAPLSGHLIGRLGELRVFSGGLVIVALSSAACAFATSYPQLLAFRALGGIGSTMFTVAAAALLIRITPYAQRGRANGAWATGFLLGTVAGPLVGGGLIAVDLRLPFLVYAGLLVVVATLTARTLRKRWTGSADLERSAVGVATFLVAIRHPAYRAALASNFVNGWTVYGVRIALVPLFVVEVLARPAAWSGVVLAVTAAGTAVSLGLGGWLADTRGHRLPVLLGLAGTAVASLWLGFTTSLPGFLAAALLTGVATGLTSPPTNAAVADLIAADGRTISSGSALAGFQMVGDVGAVVGPVLAGAVVDLWGYPAAFAATALVAAAAFACWLRSPDTR